MASGNKLRTTITVLCCRQLGKLVCSVVSDLKLVVAKARARGMTVPKGFMTGHIQKYLWLAKEGILSTEGAKKHVATFRDISIALTNAYQMTEHHDPSYTIQTIAFCLALLYTGLRPGSLISAKVNLSGYDNTRTRSTFDPSRCIKSGHNSVLSTKSWVTCNTGTALSLLLTKEGLQNNLGCCSLGRKLSKAVKVTANLWSIL
ncbi:hypothetical protein BC941DRAFT_455991 [Chlamydoabsidia padenii]|nr:hypothetical protein BC941DRAFT_455991 [Chlamydoabsidia padenii]